MNSTAELPYELHTHGSGAFVIFNVADQIAFPLLTLAKATLRATKEGDELVLEFQSAQVVIGGRGLAPMMDHLLAGQVKKISRANDSTCQVAAIRVGEF